MTRVTPVQTFPDDDYAHILLSASGRVLAVYAAKDDAEAKRDAYNADPWLDAETPDPDAPYRVESWHVQVAS